MSADTLRRAAALMRERAEAAAKVHAAPWKPMGAGSVTYPMTTRMSGTVAETYPKGGSADQIATTDHIASWHPAVALAVADWMDSTANDVEHVHTPVYNLTSTTVARAVAVAETYLALAHPSTDPDG